MATTSTNADMFGDLRDNDTGVRNAGWAQFDSRYRPVIWGYCRRKGLGAADADDIVQKVLIGFFGASRKFVYDPKKGRFRDYLRRCTNNALSDFFKSDRPDRLPEAFEEFLPAGKDEDPWLSEWDRNIALRALDNARAFVEPRTYAMFVQYAVQHVPAGAVATEFGVDVSTVSQSKHRVLKAAKACAKAIQHEDESEAGGYASTND